MEIGVLEYAAYSLSVNKVSRECGVICEGQLSTALRTAVLGLPLVVSVEVEYLGLIAPHLNSTIEIDLVEAILQFLLTTNFVMITYDNILQHKDNII